MRFEFLPAFKGDCFLIHAGTDDEPVLILVDGGPAGTYDDHLRPRLMELRDERGLDDFTPLVIDLVIVSHVDDDHINGIIALLREIFRDKQRGNPPLFEVGGLWHNSFDEIIGNKEVTASAAQFGAASFSLCIDKSERQEELDAGLVLASVKQGQELRDLATSQELAISLNDSFDRLIMTDAGAITTRRFGNVTFTIIGPRPSELEELRKEHDKWLKKRKAEGKKITPGSLLQALADTSAANLSSIVLLADDGERTALLTGDARSDFIIKGLEEIGLIEPGATLEVDLLKMPHHGSDRNVDEEFLQRVPAQQYLFSGNGEHGNPERETLEMLHRARPNAGMELYLTYSADEIDPQRKRVHEDERAKELAKKAKGKLKGREPRPPWSDADHSLAALIEKLPNTMRVVEPQGLVTKL